MQRILLDVRYEDVLPSRERVELKDFLMAAVLTKPTCWAYEQEMRLISQTGDQLNDIPEDVIKEISFGANMTQERVKEIMEAVTSSGMKVEFIQMEFIENGFGVRPKWIN